MKIKATLFFFMAISGSFVFAQNYLMNATLTNVNSCNGFFMDSGGGSSEYGPGENFTTTICPDTSSGTHIQLIFSGPDLGAGDQLCFYDGLNANSPMLACSNDFLPGAAFIIQATAANNSGCLTVVFSSDAADVGSGWSAKINCIAACQIITSVLESSDPMVEPLDTGWIDICPGDRVFFTGRGEYPQNGVAYSHSDFTSDFEWDLGDGNYSFGPTISHVYDEPGGYIVQLEITDQFGCKNTNFITQRIRVAPRPQFNLGDWPNQICAGDTVDLNAMVNDVNNMYTVSVEGTEEDFQTSGVRSDSLALPDGDGSSYSTTISFTGFSPGQILSNINDLLGIWVNMEHSWMRDLEIALTCPNGQSIILHDHPAPIGGEVFLGIPNEGDEINTPPVPGIGFDYGWQSNPDFNATWIEYANGTFPPVTTLPSGSYEPFQPLTQLLGCPLNGDWTITVTDLWAIDNGFIFSWNIDFDPDLYPAVETFSPQLVDWSWSNHPSIFYSEPDSIGASPENAGEVAYSFSVDDEFGCAWDTTVNIQILPFTHPDCHNCAEIITPPADTAICEGETYEIDITATGPAGGSRKF